MSKCNSHNQRPITLAFQASPPDAPPRSQQALTGLAESLITGSGHTLGRVRTSLSCMRRAGDNGPIGFPCYILPVPAA